jgi:hypothetical protein
VPQISRGVPLLFFFLPLPFVVVGGSEYCSRSTCRTGATVGREGNEYSDPTTGTSSTGFPFIDVAVGAT